MSILERVRTLYRVLISYNTLTSLIVLFLYTLVSNNIKYDQLITANNTIMTLLGVFLGFLLTGMAILLSFTNSDLIINLKKTKHYNEMINNILITFKLLCLTIIIGIINLFIVNILWLRFIMGLYVFFTALSLLNLRLTGKRLFVVLKNL